MERLFGMGNAAQAVIATTYCLALVALVHGLLQILRIR